MLFWNPSVFVPGSGNLLRGNNQTADSNQITPDLIKKTMEENNITWDQALAYLKLATGQTRTTESDNDFNGYPNSSRVTTTRRS